LRVGPAEAALDRCGGALDRVGVGDIAWSRQGPIAECRHLARGDIEPFLAARDEADPRAAPRKRAGGGVANARARPG
jgi:hypothetical protein